MKFCKCVDCPLILVLGLLAARAMAGTVLPVAPEDGGAGIERALARAREIHRTDPAAAVTIRLAPGDYPLARTLEFGAADAKLRVEGRGARLACGRSLGAFAARADGVWEAAAPAGVAFQDLYVNGRRAQRASEPNRHFLYMKREAPEVYRGFFAQERDLAFLRRIPADELKDVRLRIYQSWDMGYTGLERVDFATGHVLTQTPMAYRLFSFGTFAPRYAIENCRAALDAPGEWFLDRKAGKVLYIPRAGETVGETTAAYPRVECAVRLRQAREIVFDGLAIEHVAWNMPAKGIVNRQIAYNVGAAAVDVQACEGIVFRNCRVAHVGAHGVRIAEASRDCRIEHSLVEDVGASAVLLGDEAWKPKGYQRVELASRRPHGERLAVRDSIIRHGGRVLEGGAGVVLLQASDSEIVHNDIYDFRYTGVSAGWTWGYAPTPVRNNRIDFNRIHHIGQGRLSDMAGIYTLGDSRGSTVNGNWIWEVNGYRSGGSPAWGLYTDEGSRGLLFASNLVERCRAGAVHQHFGRDNVFANNILTGFDEFGVWRSKSEPHVTIALKNNIFYWTNPAAKALTGGGPAGELTNIVAEANLWYPAGTGGNLSADSFNGADWAEWRRQGHDARGRVADPQFVDPARRDWRLKPGSPAFATGFREFDWTAAGVPKTDPAWRAKADERTWDDFEDAPLPPEVNVTAGRCDFESGTAGKSAIASMNNFLVPFNPESSHGASMMVTDRNPAEGRKCVVFRELPGLRFPWYPIINCKLKLHACKVLVRFSARPVAGDYLLQVEPRNYRGRRGGAYLTGLAVRLAKGGVFAGGRRIASLAADRWTDVKLHLDLVARTWTVEAATRGGEAGSCGGKLPAGFDTLTYLGFISYGREGGEIALDDLEFREER